MECSMIAQTQHQQQEIAGYQYLSSKALKFDSKKLNDLSRNVLVVVCEYLSFFQIVMLTASNKRIKCKLDNFLEPSCEVSYLKRRAIIYFQSFFFQQFPTTDVLFKRMGSITSSSTMASQTGFLPLTKQSSLCLIQQKSISQMAKYQQQIPFEIDSEMQISTASARRKLLDKMDDSKSSNYIEETYKRWRTLYLEALENKQNFVNVSKNEFYSVFVQEAEEYAKEIFLDPSLCENPFFALPQLTRENFTQKGLFYRTEKILVQNYYNCFQKNSVDYTKQLLWDINVDMQNQISSDKVSLQVLRDLLNVGYFDQKDLDNINLRQGSTIKYELQSQKCDSVMQLQSLNMDALDDLDDLEMELELPSLGSFGGCGGSVGFQLTRSQPVLEPSSFLDSGVGQNPQNSKDEISILYRNIASYTLRQFKLLCNAHKQQLDFILQQIQMAPPQKQDYFIFLEDYIAKEKNLRYLFRKVSQNFVVQESFSETMQRSNIISRDQLKRAPYFSDFLLLEYMDAIWINQIYTQHCDNLVEIAKKEIQDVHQMERIDELQDKKETFRKVINVVNQMDFNLNSGNQLLAISACDNQNINKTDNQGIIKSRYKDLELHVQSSVRGLLKQFQRKSQTVAEYIQLCSHYESFNFHIIQELEYYYVLTKKHYLAKAFAHEFGTRLENNKYCSNYNGSPQRSPTQDLNFNQIIPQDLVNSFFHQLLRDMFKEPKLKEFMEYDQFLYSLFMMFNIDQLEKAQFAYQVNQYLIECHSKLEDLIQQQPELQEVGMVVEEVKKEDDPTAQKVGCSNTQGPFTLIASDEDEENNQILMAMPGLSRGYSDQKKQYQKGLRSVIFFTFRQTESKFDFKTLVQQIKAAEKRRMIDSIQERISNFNMTLQGQNVDMNEVDDDELPDPSSLGNFQHQSSSILDVSAQSMHLHSQSYNYHISSSQEIININKNQNL